MTPPPSPPDMNLKLVGELVAIHFPLDGWDGMGRMDGYLGQCQSGHEGFAATFLSYI